MVDVTRTTVDEFLETARRMIGRVTPVEARQAQLAGARLIDTRDAADLAREGVIPGAIHLPLSVLPWRVDPASEFTDSRVNQLDAQLILLCNHGYSSSWAAALLVELGFTAVSDVIGGFQEWAATGLPIEPLAGHRDTPPAPDRRPPSRVDRSAAPT